MPKEVTSKVRHQGEKVRHQGGGPEVVLKVRHNGDWSRKWYKNESDIMGIRIRHQGGIKSQTSRSGARSGIKSRLKGEGRKWYKKSDIKIRSGRGMKSQTSLSGAGSSIKSQLKGEEPEMV